MSENEEGRCVHGVVTGKSGCILCERDAIKPHVKRCLATVDSLEGYVTDIDRFLERLPAEVDNWKGTVVALTQEKYLAEARVEALERAAEENSKKIDVLEAKNRDLVADVSGRSLPNTVEWVPEEHLNEAKQQLSAFEQIVRELKKTLNAREKEVLALKQQLEEGDL